MPESFSHTIFCFLLKGLKASNAINGVWQGDESMESIAKSCVRCGMVLPKENFTDYFKGVSPSKKRNGFMKETTDGMNGTWSCCCDDSRSSDAEAVRREKMSVKSRISFFEDRDPRKYPSTVGTTIRHAKSMTNLLDCETDREAPKVADLQTCPKKVALAPSRCPFSGKRELKNVRLKNYVSSTQQNDTLHLKAKV